MKKQTSLKTIAQILVVTTALALIGIAVNISVNIFHWGDGDVTMCTLRDSKGGRDLWKNKSLLEAAGFQKDANGNSWNKTFKGGCDLTKLDKALIEAGYGIEKDPNFPEMTIGHNPPSEKGWGSWPEGRKPVTKDPGPMPGSEWPIAIGLGVFIATLIGGFLIRQRVSA